MISVSDSRTATALHNIAESSRYSTSRQKHGFVHIIFLIDLLKSRNSSVGIATAYGLDNERVGVGAVLKLLLLLFIFTGNGFSPGGSGTTIRHNTQITQ
jgi:hypothetical protein